MCALAVESITLDPQVNRSYLLLSNLQSGSNIGSICRNSLAFGVSEVIIVGRREFTGKMRGADRGAKFKQNFANFPSTDVILSFCY
jgi:tRNA G18 (ribose-2'-O)-methylase SpoU